MPRSTRSSTQARTIAAAIAWNARVEPGGLTFDPDRAGRAGPARGPFGDDTFADIRLAIAPERVGPVLATTDPVGDVRARIYGPDGFQILDSNQRLQRGQLTPLRLGPSRRFPTRSCAAPGRDLSRCSAAKACRSIATSPANVARSTRRSRERSRGTRHTMLLVNAAGQQSVAVAAADRDPGTRARRHRAVVATGRSRRCALAPAPRHAGAVDDRAAGLARVRLGAAADDRGADEPPVGCGRARHAARSTRSTSCRTFRTAATRSARWRWRSRR